MVNKKIMLRGYWGFDAHSVTIQYTKNIAAIFEMFSDLINFLTIGQPLLVNHPVWEVVGHNTDGHIIECFRI